MEIIRKNIKWIVMFICVILFIAIVKNIFENDIDKFDYVIYSVISNFINPVVTAIFKIITHFGDWTIMLPICILCILTFKEKLYKYMVIVNIITVFILNQILKIIVNRERPVGNRLIDVSGYSFPSGHSMVSMAFYGLFIYLAYKHIENKKIRYLICTFLTVLILAIGISRIYLGVHYASDVAGGFLISIAYLILFTQIAKQRSLK